MRGPTVHGRKSAFTLIELLVVVSVIALLISILLPSLRSSRDQAKKVKCMANLHAIGIALVTYADDNNQELPSYETMGMHAYRIRPRLRLTPDSPEESWGVQSVLEAGAAPEVLPNGLAHPLVPDKPVYLPGDSDVWICPANPGLWGREDEWKSWGNGYSYRTNSTGTYNLDRLSMSAGGQKNPLVWDNYFQYPGESGFIGPFKGPGYRVPTEHRTPPHRLIGGKKRASAKYWIAYYARGHCQINAHNQ